MDGVVCLDLPGKDDVLLLRGDLEGVVVPFPAKEAGQDLNEAGVGSHEVVIDQPSTMHTHLQSTVTVSTYSRCHCTCHRVILIEKLLVVTKVWHMVLSKHGQWQVTSLVCTLNAAKNWLRRTSS